jgi:hypothetical protein
VLNNHLSSTLPSLLSTSDIQRISDSLQYINTLPDSTRDTVRQTFADGYNNQLRVMLYFSAVVWVCTLMLWERKLRRVVDVEGY